MRSQAGFPQWGLFPDLPARRAALGAWLREAAAARPLPAPTRVFLGFGPDDAVDPVEAGVAAGASGADYSAAGLRRALTADVAYDAAGREGTALLLGRVRRLEEALAELK